MANINVTRQGPEVQWDDTDRGDYIRLSQRDIDPALRSRANGDVIRSWGLVLGAFALLLLLVLYGLAGWQCRPEANVFETSVACYAAQTFFWLYLAGLVVAPLAGAATMLWSYRRRTLAETERALITRDAWSNPVHADVLRQMGAGWAVYQFNQRQAHEQAVAPYKVLPGGLENLSLHNSVSGGKTVEQLPEPEDAPRVMTAREVYDRLNNLPDDDPHCFVYGSSGTGKTTFVRGLLADRDGFLLVIDPKPEGAMKWGGIPYVTIDDDGDYGPIRDAISAVLAEFRERQAVGRIKPQEFPTITVVVDEFFLALQNVPELGTLVKLVSSVGRSLRVRLVLMSQSSRVKSLGLEGLGDLLENFTKVYLGRYATDKVPDAAKYASSAKKAGVVMDGEEPVVIDTRDVPDLAQRPLTVVPWTPEDRTLVTLGPETEELLERLLAGTAGTGSGVINTSAGRDTEELVPLVPGGSDEDRLAQARTLARHTEMSANEIARKVGGRKEAVLAAVREVRGVK